jgi:hypothetical protein
MIEMAESLAELYESDETAWLEAMADLIARGKHTELDYEHLLEYLTDMAKRDKREVKNRLRTLLAHLLKWTHQKEKRTPSWRNTIKIQRQDLADLLESRVLSNHAENVLSAAFKDAVDYAVAETSLPENQFPRKCPWTLEMLLADDLPEE